MVVTLTTRDPSALVVLSMFLFGSLNVAAAVAGTAVAIGGADGYPPTTMSGSSFNNTIVFVVIALSRERGFAYNFMSLVAGTVCGRVASVRR